MTEELHISSLVVHAMPARLTSVSDLICAIESARVHATSPAGKLVVTVEASSAGEMMSKVNRIQQIEGVLSAALVYQCVDTLEAMNEVIPHADDPKGIH